MRSTPLCSLWDFPPPRPTEPGITRYWKRWIELFDLVKVAVDARTLFDGGNPRLQHSGGIRTLEGAVDLCLRAAVDGHPVKLIVVATYLKAGTANGQGWHAGYDWRPTPQQRVTLWKRVRVRYGDVLYGCQDDYEFEVQPGASDAQRNKELNWYHTGAEAVAASWPAEGPHYVLGGLAGEREPRSLAAYLKGRASATLKKRTVFDYHDYSSEGRARYDLDQLRRSGWRTMIGEAFTGNNKHPNIEWMRHHAAMASATNQLVFAIPGGQFSVDRWRTQDTRRWAVWDRRGKRIEPNWQESLACGRALDGALEGAVILPHGLTLDDVYALDAMQDEVAEGVPVALRFGPKGKTVDWQKPLGVGHHGQELFPAWSEAWGEYHDGTLAHD